MTYDTQHGTQVEYDAPNGKTYLLYPGNPVVVQGGWKLTKTDKPNVFDICYLYPANSYNPATHQPGGSWECQIAGLFLGRVKEFKPGDVLGLARSPKAPFVLSREPTTLGALMARR